MRNVLQERPLGAKALLHPFGHRIESDRYLAYLVLSSGHNARLHVPVPEFAQGIANAAERKYEIQQREEKEACRDHYAGREVSPGCGACLDGCSEDSETILSVVGELSQMECAMFVPAKPPVWIYR